MAPKNNDIGPFTGHCLCGKSTFKADVKEPLIVGYDHCDDCQRQSGSTYSLVVVVKTDDLVINGEKLSRNGDQLTASGSVKVYSGSKGSSGNIVHRLFCSDCGSPIAHAPDADKSIIALKGGLLDENLKKELQPEHEIWTVGKLKFCQEKLDIPHEHMP